MHFNACVVRGQGRGKGLGTPTINLAIESIPKNILHGIYAGWVTIDNQKFLAAMHYGPKPFYKEEVSFEVHAIDAALGEIPENVDIALVKKIRDIQNFSSEAALKQQMQKDIAEARGIL